MAPRNPAFREKAPYHSPWLQARTPGLPEGPGEEYMLYKDGTAFAKEIGTILHLECSAKEDTSFEDFSAAIAKIRMIVDSENKEKTMRNCFGQKKSREVMVIISRVVVLVASPLHLAIETRTKRLELLSLVIVCLLQNH